MTGEGLIISFATGVFEGRKVVACDVPGAFLNSDVVGDVYVVVDRIGNMKESLMSPKVEQELCI